MTVNINDYPTINLQDIPCGNAPMPKSKPKISIDALMEIITYVKYIDDTLTNHSAIIENLRKDVSLIKKELDHQSDVNKEFRNAIYSKELRGL
jgi:hypothetical protein